MSHVSGSSCVIGSPGHSPALQYEIQLAEAVAQSGQDGITPERIDLCFSILDDLTPRLGVYQQIMRMLKQELFKAVYSTEYTARGDRLVRKRTSAKPSQVPHFTVAKRCMEEWDQQVGKLKQQIDSLKEQLYTCEAELEKASSSIEASRHDIRERDSRIQKLMGDLRSVMEERDKLQQLGSHGQQLRNRLAQEAEYKIASLKGTIATLTNQNTILLQYKLTHDAVQDALVLSKKPSIGTSTGDSEEQPPLSSLTATLNHELTTAQTLRHQLLVIQNTLIDEYDKYLTDRKPQHHSTIGGISRSRKGGNNFTCNMKELLKELELLDTHISCLHSRLHQVQHVSQTHPHEAIVHANHPATPLVVQEQLLNKYSAMVYVSCDDATSFYPLKEGRDCLNCGEKTVICPHKPFSSEQLIQLPLSSTHIKICRPLLHMTTTPGHQITEDEGKATSGRLELSTASTGTGRQVDSGTISPGMRPGSTDHVMEVDSTAIWDHYTVTYGVPSSERIVPRQLSADNVLLLFQLYCCLELHHDETPPTSTGTQSPSPLAALYQFLSNRYLMTAVAPLVIHDFLSGLLKHHHTHIELHVFAHVLSAAVDGATVRYLLLLAELVDKLSWDSNQYFTVWCSTVYPFLTDEELEQFSINYVSYSGNKISYTAVMRYLCWVLLKHREPLVIKMEATLNDHQTQLPGSMTEAEFAEAMLSLCPTAPDHLLYRLFGQSIAQLRERGREIESVPTRRLAYVAAYISLSLSLTNCTQQLEAGQPHRSPVKHTADNVIKLSSVKALTTCLT